MTEDELILTSILNCSRSDLYLRKPQLTAQQQKQVEDYKHRRQNGEPLQYILGSCDFMGLELKVDPRVLIPRPETEVLVDEAIKKLGTAPYFLEEESNKNRALSPILDLGTGSGNIAIALAKSLANVSVTAVDISQDALDVARENAIKHGVDDRIKFVQADMGDYLADSKGQFDLIISNPPYISTNQMKTLPADVQQEPRIALEAGQDGLKFYIDIIKYTPPLLRTGAYLMMECGEGQAESICSMLRISKSFSHIETIKDLTGRDRIILAIKE